MMIKNRAMMGLVITEVSPPKTPEASILPTVPALRASVIPVARASMLPYPVMPLVRPACRSTASLYSSTGTSVKLPTAIKPLIAPRAVSFTLARPV